VGPIHSRLGPSRGCGQRGRVRDHDELSKVIRPHTFHPSRHHHAHARRRTMDWNCVSESQLFTHSAGSSVGMDPTRAHTPTTCNAHPKPLFLRACFHASLARVHSHTHTIISRVRVHTHACTHTHTHAHTRTHVHTRTRTQAGGAPRDIITCGIGVNCRVGESRTRGEFFGIVVDKIVPGSPADRSGKIQAGDLIVATDGTDCIIVDDDPGNLLLGPEGSTVRTPRDTNRMCNSCYLHLHVCEALMFARTHSKKVKCTQVRFCSHWCPHSISRWKQELTLGCISRT